LHSFLVGGSAEARSTSEVGGRRQRVMGGDGSGGSGGSHS